jgi:hypothetical protein
MELTKNEQNLLRFLYKKRGSASMGETNRGTKLHDFDVIKAINSLKDKGYSIRGKRLHGGPHRYEYIQLSIPIKKTEHQTFLESFQ